MNFFARIDIYRRLALILGLLGIFSAQTVLSREVGGVSFPEKVSIAGQDCQLMGIGMRKKFFVDVYLGGLYLKTPTQDPHEVISSEQPKRVLLHVIYKQVDADKWVEGWKEGFQKSVSEPNQALETQISQFIGFFDKPVLKGETVQLTYLPGQGTEVVIRGQSKGTIPGRDFMTALWSIWFGPNPASESLKEGMLGK